MPIAPEEPAHRVWLVIGRDLCIKAPIDWIHTQIAAGIKRLGLITASGFCPLQSSGHTELGRRPGMQVHKEISRENFLSSSLLSTSFFSPAQLHC